MKFFESLLFLRFRDSEIYSENLGDLFRLQTILAALPDEKLIQKLQKIRGKGRNEWSVTALWNSFVASFIFDHDSVASLLRELKRNSQLRIICGFEPHFYKSKGNVEKIIHCKVNSFGGNLHG